MTSVVSEFARRLGLAIAQPIVKENPAIVEAARKATHAPKGFELRTPADEVLIQDGTPEAMEWARITKLHRGNEMYARETARNIISKLTKKYEASWLKLGHGKAMLEVLELASDRKYLYDLMGVFQVEENHQELAVNLVQGVIRIRFGGK